MNVVTQFPAARDCDPDHRFFAMFEGAAIGIGVCQLDGRILEPNPALCRSLGYTKLELTGKHARELYTKPERESHPEITREIFPGNLASGNLSPGNPSPCNLAPDKLQMSELMLGARDSVDFDQRCRRKDGSEFWGHWTLSVARDGRRQPAFLIVMLADATGRKRLEELLREAEKMEIIGRLTAGIAHDFNNLLTGVLLYCDLLSAGCATAESEISGLVNSGPELRQHVEEVRMASEQGAALTHQLLAIARRQSSEPRPTPINEIVASIKNLLRRLLGKQIELTIDSDSALDLNGGLVLADPAQLRQILLNLVLNARDAMPLGGKIGLRTRAAEFHGDGSGEKRSKLAPAQARRAVSVVVQDNGCGMDAETRGRLFEPFFTTKRPGKGTGLGLATVQRIVGELGGTIEVESEPGRGTSIRVLLPAIDLRPRGSGA